MIFLSGLVFCIVSIALIELGNARIEAMKLKQSLSKEIQRK